ncbi:F0F1 ATP synthase subunit B [bacterium]|nr:F0F1 ATP synthase subunit B [bacterium]
MLHKKQILVLFLTIPLFIGMASQDEHGSRTRDLLAQALNFVVLFGGLTYLLYKPFRSLLNQRTQDIQNKLQEAEKSQKQAQKKLKEAQKRLKRVGEETEKMKKQSRKEGKKEKEKILQQAQEEVKTIKKDTQEEIENITSVGVQELKEYVADLSVQLAEQRIRRKMSSQDQFRIIQESIQRIGEMYEK